ncbi:MAG: SPOR domain-containing protein, partial [Muribaculaceae bacterium]|nr:SPOR domain-containing protein [Muribaculaceae bacterium]
SLQNIVDELQADGIISVELPQSLYDRLQPVETPADAKEAQPSSVGRMAGYRVQAFSGNSANAKREGQTRENQIRNFFPEYRCNLVYNAPYWRLRVGDFRTRAEAEEAAATMKRAFPAFKREITVVRDRIAPNY